MSIRFVLKLAKYGKMATKSQNVSSPENTRQSQCLDMVHTTKKLVPVHPRWNESNFIFSMHLARGIQSMKSMIDDNRNQSKPIDIT